MQLFQCKLYLRFFKHIFTFLVVKFVRSIQDSSFVSRTQGNISFQMTRRQWIWQLHFIIYEKNIQKIYMYYCLRKQFSHESVAILGIPKLIYLVSLLDTHQGIDISLGSMAVLFDPWEFLLYAACKEIFAYCLSAGSGIFLDVRCDNRTRGQFGTGELGKHDANTFAPLAFYKFIQITFFNY